MNAQELIKVIENPGLLARKSKDDIERLVKQYPYCATLHMLWLKTLKYLDHTDFNESLHFSSAFIHDRSRFYNWLNFNHAKPAPQPAQEALQKKPPEIKEGYTQEEKEALIQNDLRQIEKEQDYPQAENPDISSDIEKEAGKTENEGHKEISKPDPFELIDKFINKEPRIIPDKERSFDEETAQADQSLKDNQEIISETLALIYQRQGKKQKAIEIYKKLSLKFPEKKRYFANLIQKIEEN